MRVLQVILPIYFSLCNVSNVLSEDVDTIDLSEISTYKKSSSGSSKGSKASNSGSSKGTKAPTGGSAKSSKSSKSTKAPEVTVTGTQTASDSPKSGKGTKAPEVTATATQTATQTISDAPTSAPTALCIGSNFFATFDAPKQSPDDKGMKGSMKGTYLDGNKVDIKLSINFGQRTFNKVKLNEGDLLDWSINTSWENPDTFGWNNKCRPGRTGKHHDRSVACSSLSEFNEDGTCTRPNGRQVKAIDYNCKSKKADNTCERGDLTGKLGPLVVTSTVNGFPKVTFKGIDKFFLKRKDAEEAEEINEPYSIVISKDGENFICAQFILICDN